jgi:hypothetical protein
MKRIGASPVDNSPRGQAAKIEIRRHILTELGGEARVFDAFAGAGHMYRAVWREAACYSGCDKRYFADGRRMFAADNRRVLRSIDLSAFNVFDLDAYGSPWEQALIIAERRKAAPAERIAFALTEGDGLSYKGNIVPAAVSQLIGLENGKTPALCRRRDEVVQRLLLALADRMGARMTRCWAACNMQGMAVWYLGAVFSGAARPGADSDRRAAEMAAGLS